MVKEWKVIGFFVFVFLTQYLFSNETLRYINKCRGHSKNNCLYENLHSKRKSRYFNFKKNLIINKTISNNPNNTTNVFSGNNKFLPLSTYKPLDYNQQIQWSSNLDYNFGPLWYDSNGDGIGEITTWDDHNGRLDFYDGSNGSIKASINVVKPNPDWVAGIYTNDDNDDSFAVTDVDGDGKKEFIVEISSYGDLGAGIIGSRLQLYDADTKSLKAEIDSGASDYCGSGYWCWVDWLVDNVDSDSQKEINNL